MAKTLQKLMRVLLVRVAVRYERLAIQLARIKAAMWYVKSVQTARLAFLGYVGIKALIILIGMGVVLVHVGFFL